MRRSSLSQILIKPWRSLRAGRELLAVGGESQGKNAARAGGNGHQRLRVARLPGIFAAFGPGLRIPDLYDAAPAAGGKAFSVG